MLNEIKLKRLPSTASGINDDHAEVKNWEHVGTEGDVGASDILQVKLYQKQKGMQRVIASPVHWL